MMNFKDAREKECKYEILFFIDYIVKFLIE